MGLVGEEAWKRRLGGCFWALEGLWWVVPGVLGRGFWFGGGFVGGLCVLQRLTLLVKQVQKKKLG